MEKKPYIKREVKRVNLKLTPEETGKSTIIHSVGFAYKKLIDGIYQWIVKTIYGIVYRLEEELTFNFLGTQSHLNYSLKINW